MTAPENANRQPTWQHQMTTPDGKPRWQRQRTALNYNQMTTSDKIARWNIITPGDKNRTTTEDIPDDSSDDDFKRQGISHDSTDDDVKRQGISHDSTILQH
jgi:hypothetical protein